MEFIKTMTVIISFLTLMFFSYVLLYFFPQYLSASMASGFNIIHIIIPVFIIPLFLFSFPLIFAIDSDFFDPKKNNFDLIHKIFNVKIEDKQGHKIASAVISTALFIVAWAISYNVLVRMLDLYKS